MNLSPRLGERKTHTEKLHGKVKKGRVYVGTSKKLHSGRWEAETKEESHKISTSQDPTGPSEGTRGRGGGSEIWEK